MKSRSTQSHRVHRILALSTLAAVAVTFAVSSTVRADRSGGGGVGNGGGAWTCRSNTADDTLNWVQLVDLSEAEREYAEPIPHTGPMTGAIPTPQEWLASNNRYLISAENKIQAANPAFFAEYMLRKSNLIKKQLVTVPTDSEFDRTSDIRHHTRPSDSTCPDGHILQEPEQLANFTNLGHLEINGKLWYSPALSEVDRSALFVHEVIYWIFRDVAGDTDSLRTRLIVGYLFSSTKPVQQYAEMITLAPPPAGTRGIPIVYGMFAELAGRWIDIEVNSYDTVNNILTVTQKDRDDHWKAKSHATFHCIPQGSEMQCLMTGNSKGKPAEWTDRYIRIITPTNFVWVKLNRNGSVKRATHYSKIQ